MSKHIIEQTINEQTYEVQIGWDRPLQRYYGVVSPWVENEECEEGGYFDDPVWSNLYFPHDVGLENIVDACTNLGLVIPPLMLENTVNDKLRNITNEITIYNQQGHITFSNSLRYQANQQHKPEF